MDLYRYYSPEDIAEFINVKHSNHSKSRAKQRGLTMETIKLAMLYSIAFFKQGMLFYVVKNSDLPKSFIGKQRNELKNIVVVVSGNSGEIITCYKDKNAMHNIKKKGKILFKNVA